MPTVVVTAAASIATPVFSPAPPAATPSPAPSPLPGDWAFRATTSGGVLAGTLRFQPGEPLQGTYIGLRGNATQLANLRYSGGLISFDLVTPRAVWHLQGTVSGDRIDGTFQTAERVVQWSAVRQPAPSTTPSR